MSPSPRSGRGRSGPRRAGRSSHSTGRSTGRGSNSGRGRTQPAPLTPTENPPEIDSFEEWDLGDDVQTAIADMGIVKPTPIQALAIGEVLSGKDVIAKAETGTGKTLAFGAPLMARIDPARSSVLGLVLSPTRELSEQVYNVLRPLGEARGVKVALVVGGEPLHPQVKELQAGAQVVVATPGRVIDLMGQGFLNFPWTEFVVLDEADKMLEIGFIDDVRKILEATDPDVRQTLLFSATFPPPLLELAREHTRQPAEIATASGLATVDTIAQTFLRCRDDQVPRALATVFEDSASEDVFLVFCERRTDVDQLMRRLERTRFSIKALHGGYDQASRFRVMSAFRTGEVKALLATDVASRGLDVNHVTHVVNVGVPRDVSDYTHRIGRTGRAGRKGVSMTLVTARDERRWRPLIAQVPWEITELKNPRELARIERAHAGTDEQEQEEREERAPRRRSRNERQEERPRRERTRERTRRDEESEERPRRRRTRSSEREGAPERERDEEERPRRRRTRSSERERGERESVEERPRRTRTRSNPYLDDAPEEPRRKRTRSREESEEPREERPRRPRSSEREESRERPARVRTRTRSAQDSEGSREESRGELREERPRRRRRSERAESDRPSNSEGRTRTRTRTEKDDTSRDSGRRSSKGAPEERKREPRSQTNAQPDARTEPKAAESKTPEPRTAEPSAAATPFGAGVEPEAPKKESRKKTAKKSAAKKTAKKAAKKKTAKKAAKKKAAKKKSTKKASKKKAAKKKSAAKKAGASKKKTEKSAPHAGDSSFGVGL